MPKNVYYMALTSCKYRQHATLKNMSKAANLAMLFNHYFSGVKSYIETYSVRIIILPLSFLWSPNMRTTSSFSLFTQQVEMTYQNDKSSQMESVYSTILALHTTTKRFSMFLHFKTFLNFKRDPLLQNRPKNVRLGCI